MHRPFHPLLLTPLLLCLVAPAALAQDADAQAAAAPQENVASGKIDAVTVYRGQALVTRTIDPPALGGDGTAELVITDLPANVVPGSLYAESDSASVEVRSVRYRTRPVQEDVREEVRTIEEKIEEVQRQIQRTQNLQQVLQQKRAYLDNLEKFSADTTDRDLKQGVLDAEQLVNLTEFLFEQREQLALREVELREQLAEQQEELQLLQRQRSNVAGSSSRTVREAVVFLGKAAGEGDGGGEGGGVAVRYLVNGASWSPSYNLRAPEGAGAAEGEEGDEGGERNVTLEYYASVQQTSGEDWTNVNMTLSTATPSLIASPPGLEPLVVTLDSIAAPNASPTAVANMKLQVEAKGYVQLRRELEAQQQETTRARQSAANTFRAGAGAGPTGEEAAQMSYSRDAFAPGDLDASLGRDFDNQMNRWSKEIQVLDLVAGRESLRGVSGGGGGGLPEPPSMRSDASEGVSVTYDLPGRTSLPSRSDRQLVQIAQLELPAEFYNRATPVLGPYVYHVAEATNTSDMVLLAGPTQAFEGGEFVGRGSIPMVASGEKFTAGFGIDASLRADRELVDRTERTQGGNVVTKFTYRVTLENFGDAPADVRVLDRLPHPQRNVAGEELKVELVSTDPELSDDKEYQRFARELGILRWNVDVPANTTGGEAETITFTFDIEHDRQMTLALPETRRSGAEREGGDRSDDGFDREMREGRVEELTF